MLNPEDKQEFKDKNEGRSIYRQVNDDIGSTLEEAGVT
jgi:hypothetical protein